MGQLRILRGGWGIFGRPTFEVGDVVEEAELPEDLVRGLLASGKAEKAEKVPAAPAKRKGVN